MPRPQFGQKPGVQMQEMIYRLTMHDLLRAVVEHGASDLHLSGDDHVKIRVDGQLRDLTLSHQPVRLDAEKCEQLLQGILTEEQRQRLEENRQLDLAYSAPALGRFRVNIYRAMGRLHGAFRIIPDQILSLDQLQMPRVLKDLAGSPVGLVLVTGPTGSGKSTTLAAMVDEINRRRPVHILTIEDPIEFIHPSKRALVHQREIEQDTHTFADALKAALREDPDVILVGEMRDPETMALALEAAETGHLVLSTLHTQDAAQTVDRIIQSFPANQQAQIRAQLSLTLQGVISQRLLRRKEGRGRVAALEVLVATPAVRNHIREGTTEQIYSVIQTGAKHGMKTLEQTLAELVVSGVVDKMEAAAVSARSEELDALIIQAAQRRQ